MHEVEHLAPPQSDSWEDIKAWRKQQREALIYPQAHDIPMSRIVTDRA